MKPPHVGYLLLAVSLLAMMLGAVVVGMDHRWAARLGARATCQATALDYAVLQARYDSLLATWNRDPKRRR